ncbi:MAG: MgtC/SapB family protein [Lachnoclostridium sp.]|nr:MgtC/SapB family protein [Lachnoclostridium sp.]
MWQNFLDSINAVELTTANAIFRLVVALILGSAIGLERKRKGQIAGLRTFALISMGACLAMILSIYVPQEYLGLKNGDPGRIAAQVITGIGFLGAGAIIQMKGSVRGLTTAAGIWIVATIGMAVGVGMYIVAIAATLAVLAVLTLLELIEYHIRIGKEARTIRMKVKGIIRSIDDYRKVLEEYDIHLSRVYVDYEYEADFTRLNFLILVDERFDFLEVFDRMSRINDPISISLSNQADLS